MSLIRSVTAVHRTVASALAIVTVCQLPAFLTGALAVQVRAELDFTAARLGLAIGGFFLASALTSAIAGRIVERLGWRTGLRTGVAITATSLAAVAVSAHTWAALAGLLVLAGVGMALAQPAANLALVRVVPISRYGLVFGIKQSAIVLATLLGGLSVPTIALTVGWRWAYGLAAAGGVVAAVAVPRVPAAERRPVGSQVPARANPSAEPAAPVDRDRARLPAAAVRGLVLVATAGCGAAMVGNAFGAFLVSSAVAGGLGPGAAGLLLAAGSVCGLVVRVAAGWLADRRPFHPLGAMAALLVVGSAGCLLLATGAAAPLILGALLGVGAGWGWPGLYNLAVVRAHPATAAFATGIAQTGIYAGAASGPVVFGLLADSVGFAGAWLAIALLALASAALAARGRRVLRDQTRR